MKIIVFTIIALFFSSCNKPGEISSETKTIMSMNQTVLNSTEIIKEHNKLHFYVINNAFGPYKKLRKYVDFSNMVNKKVKEIDDFIEQLKVKILEEANETNAIIRNENITEIDYLKIEDPELQNAANNLILEEKNGNKLEAYYNNLFKSITTETVKHSYMKELNLTVKKYLERDPIDGQSWFEYTFKDRSLAEVLLYLNSLQLDLRMAESHCYNGALGSVSMDTPFYPVIKAQVLSNTDIIQEGDSFNFNVYLVGIDTFFRPKVFIGKCSTKEQSDLKERIDKNNSSVSFYSKVFDKQGKHLIKGHILLPTPSGDKLFPFEKEINVIKKCEK